MRLQDISFDKSLYLFELDNILFDKRDYLLQVYYLFGSFYEFSEGSVKANDMATFMKKIYEHHGEDSVFVSTKLMFGIDDKYEDNFNRLQANAQLPLKLMLLPEAEELLDNLSKLGKQIAILTKGNPVEQLNKLKFMDWGSIRGIESKLKIYFIDELEFKSFDPIEYIAEAYGLNKEDILFIDNC